MGDEQLAETIETEEISTEEESSQHEEQEVTTEEEDEQTAEGEETGTISDEQRQRIIDEAIETGQVVDYETRFKPIYGALKHAEREITGLKKGKPGEENQSRSREISTAPRPKPEDFETQEAYEDAVTDWRIEQRERTQQAQSEDERQQEIEREANRKIDDAIAKDPDFLDKTYIPEGLAPALIGRDNLIEFAYYFGAHPEEAQKILRMPQAERVYELGVLSTKLNAQPPQKKPKQIASTSPSKGKTVTTEKNPEDMTPDEYKQWREGGGGKD